MVPYMVSDESVIGVEIAFHGRGVVTHVCRQEMSFIFLQPLPSLQFFKLDNDLFSVLHHI